jgi:hypothetical protein
MKKAAVLILGLVAITLLAPNDGQTQPPEGEKPAKKPGHQQNVFLPTSSVDSMELFDRITGGRPYMTVDDLAGLESLKNEIRSSLGGNGGNGGNGGSGTGPTSQISREQFYTMIQQMKEQQRLQREQLLKQIEWQRQRLLAGDDPQHIQPMPGDSSQNQQEQKQKAAQDQKRHQKEHDQAMQQWQQQQQQQQGLDAELEAAFRSHKLNKDGYLTKENSSPLLRAQWDIWDFDGNGLIDAQEYKAYKMAERIGWKPTSGTPNPFRPSWAIDPPTPVYRKGKLPQGLPQWFMDLSANNEEAQIYLFDWRQAGRADEEFFAMDRNSDGILTADEVMSYLNQEAEAKKLLGGLVALPDPGNLMAFAGQTDKKLAFTVTGQAGGGIWGSGTYTLDSVLSVAAVHAGKIRAGETGVVVVEIVPTLEQFAGTTQNGVTSGAFGQFPQGAYRISKLSDLDKGKKGSGRKGSGSK